MEWYEELYQTDAWRKESTLARFRLDGKKAFITGGAGGLGREIAGAFAEAGADVALVDLAAKQEYGESVAKEISDKFGTKTIYVPCDIGSDDDIKAMIATVRKEFGTIDISVNNAGFVYPHERVALSCHGSGDLFASVFAGLMTLGRSLPESARTAADFTRDCIRHSMNCPDHRWYGVDYEPMLGELARRIGEERA